MPPFGLNICFGYKQIALQIATKKGTVQLAAPSNSGSATLPAKAETDGSITHAAPSAPTAAGQPADAAARQLTPPVILPTAPATLPYSRGSNASVLHPLPSEPLTGNATLGAATPSLGAWSPHQHRQPASAATAMSVPRAGVLPNSAAVALRQVEPLHTDVKPSESGVWADLAAELRSAPISLPELADPSSSLLPGATTTATAAAATAAANCAFSPTDSDNMSTVAPKNAKKAQPSRTRRKLIQAPAGGQADTMQGSGEQADVQQEVGKSTEADDTLQARPSAKPVKGRRAAGKRATAQAGAAPQLQPASGAAVRSPRRARNASAEAGANADAAAAAGESEGAVAPAEESKAAKAQKPARAPAEKAKRGNFRGTGALGLSRRLSTQILTPHEVNVLARLPLPPALQRLDQQLFPALNAMYGFLLRVHIQV